MNINDKNYYQIAENSGRQPNKKLYDRAVTIRTKSMVDPAVYLNCRCSVEDHWVKVSFENSKIIFIPRDEIMEVTIDPMSSYEEMQKVRNEAINDYLKSHSGRFPWPEGDSADEKDESI